MTWYKSAQTGSPECEMSNDELLAYSKFVINLRKKSGYQDFFPEDILRNYPSLVELVRSGYAPLAFSRCMRKEAKPWGIQGSWGPYWALEKLLLDDLGIDSMYSRHSIIDETRANLAHWFMETYMPLAVDSPNRSRDSQVVLISSKYISTEMIDAFWELDRNEREKASGSRNEMSWMIREETYATLFKNQNTSSKIQLEIAKLTGYRNDSFHWLIKNPNGSGDAMNWMLSNDKKNTFTSYGRNGVNALFFDMSPGATINDSIAEVLSHHMLKIFDSKKYDIHGKGLPDPGRTGEFSYEEKSTLMEYLIKICTKTKSKTAMQNLFSLALAMGGIQKKEHSLEPLKSRHIFNAYSPQSATLMILRLLSPFVVNHEKMDKESVQKILIYISSIDNLYMEEVMESKGMTLIGFDTLGIIWSSYRSIAGTKSFVTEQSYERHGQEFTEFMTDSKKKILDAVKSLDIKKFFAHAYSIGMPKLNMYKVAISQAKIKMGKMDSWASRL